MFDLLIYIHSVFRDSGSFILTLGRNDRSNLLSYVVPHVKLEPGSIANHWFEGRKNKSVVHWTDGSYMRLGDAST